MMGIAWWPVTLALLAAPFGVWGWHWVDTQRLLSAHSRQVDDLQRLAAKASDAAYARGQRHGIAEVRAQQQAELAKTEEAMRQLEAELEEALGAVAAPTPQEIIELCKRSASCRNRHELQ